MRKRDFRISSRKRKCSYGDQVEPFKQKRSNISWNCPFNHMACLIFHHSMPLGLLLVDRKESSMFHCQWTLTIFLNSVCFCKDSIWTAKIWKLEDTSLYILLRSSQYDSMLSRTAVCAVLDSAKLGAALSRTALSHFWFLISPFCLLLYPYIYTEETFNDF